MEPNKFNLLMLDYNFNNDTGLLRSYLSSKKKFAGMIEELKTGIAIAESDIDPVDSQSFSTINGYKKKIYTLSIDQLFKDKAEYFELYLYSKYGINRTGCWFNKNGYEITDQEIQLLLKEKHRLNYIMAHRILENYDYFLLTKQQTGNKLIFIGETSIYSLPFVIDDEPGLKNFSNYLTKYKRYPYLIIIDKKLYYSLRAVEPGLKIKPYVKKAPTY